jgi:uncharacterized membrane protein YfcA
MISDPKFYLLAVPAILMTGISKSGFGGALGGLSVPLMALAVAPDVAAGIMLPILCVMDIIGLRYFTRSVDRRNLRIMLPGALLGIGMGTLCFGLLDVRWLLLLVGLVAMGFPLLNWSGLSRRTTASSPSVLRGMFWSSLSGFTSFICHSGGPPLLAYLLPQRLERQVFVGTTVMFFLVVNYVKLVPYYFLGQLQVTNLMTSLVLLPLAPLGIYLGVWLNRRCSNETVYRAANVFLFATGIKLVHDGISGLF